VILGTLGKKSVTYYTGPKGDEKQNYYQTYLKGLVDRTTLFSYTGGVLSKTETFKDDTERTSGALPAATALDERTQIAYYKGAQGEELIDFSQDYTGVKGSESVKSTTIYSYNTDDSLFSSVVYKDTSVRTVKPDASALASLGKKSATYYSGPKG